MSVKAVRLTITAQLVGESPLRADTSVVLSEHLELGADSFGEVTEILHELHKSVEGIRDKLAGLRPRG